MPNGPSTATGGAFVACGAGGCSAQRSERVERPFAHQFETGGLRRIFVRGPSQCAQTAAGACVRIQSRPLDAPPDRFRDTAQPSGPHAAIHYGVIGPLERLGAFSEALLRVDPARSVDSRVPNPSLHYLNVTVRIEHYRAKSGLLPRAASTSVPKTL